LPSGVERICTLADTFLRQSLATADSERTISKWGGWTLLAMATPASSTPTSTATPKMSHSRARFLVLTSSCSFLRPMVLGRFALFLGAVSIDAAPRENVEGGRLSASHRVPPFLALGLPYTYRFSVLARLPPWLKGGATKALPGRPTHPPYRPSLPVSSPKNVFPLGDFSCTNFAGS
jgi:hypothetical protein